jgi:hypothetical protein
MPQELDNHIPITADKLNHGAITSTRVYDSPITTAQLSNSAIEITFLPIEIRKLDSTLIITETNSDSPVYSGTMHIDHQAKLLAYNFIFGYEKTVIVPYFSDIHDLQISTDKATYSMLQEIEKLDHFQGNALIKLIESAYKLGISHEDTDIIQGIINRAAEIQNYNSLIHVEKNSDEIITSLGSELHSACTKYFSETSVDNLSSFNLDLYNNCNKHFTRLNPDNVFTADSINDSGINDYMIAFFTFSFLLKLVSDVIQITFFYQHFEDEYRSKQTTASHIQSNIIGPYISQQNDNAFDAKFALIGALPHNIESPYRVGLPLEIASHITEYNIDSFGWNDWTFGSSFEDHWY